MSQAEQGRRFVKIKKIGEGTYGSVTKVYDNKLKIYIAVKKIKFKDDQETIPINALREIICLKEMNHPNIVQINYISYELKTQKLYIGFEYVQRTLEDLIRKLGTLSPFTIKTYMFQTLSALRYLQDRFYMHRDLKPQNIMITEQNIIKLIDFGQTKKMSIQGFFKERKTIEVSTLWYKAPQLLLGFEYYNNKIEVWSMGCIFAEMVLGRPLFQSFSQIQQIFKIFQLLGTPRFRQLGELKYWPFLLPTFPKFQSNQFQIPILGEDGNDLLRKMLAINPSQRISIEEALRHSYFLSMT